MEDIKTLIGQEKPEEETPKEEPKKEGETSEE